MEPAYWAKLVKIINYNYDYFDGFVILHGTDTMAYTASALSFMLENLSKPVILTGSQLPIGTLRTDGKENLITAIEIAAAKKSGWQLLSFRRYAFSFENHLMRGNRTTKINAENFNAFPLFQLPAYWHALAYILNTSPTSFVNQTPTKPLKPHYLFDNNVVILTLFPWHSREYCNFTPSCSRIESCRDENIRIRKCTAKRMVHPGIKRGY